MDHTVGDRAADWIPFVASSDGNSGYYETVADSARPRFLILTLTCGENELDDCRQSVVHQRGVSVEHRFFRNLENAEAHAAIYRTVEAESGNFDLFLKLDADMVLADEFVLERIAELFQREPELDHLVLGVADWFTDSNIIGVHIFSPKVQWRPNPSGLFTDPDPQFTGRKLVIEDPQPLVVRHGPDPSPFQAFFFGVHRATKACQRGFEWKDRQLFGARTNWQTLERVWHHYQHCRDPRLGLAVLGADMVFRGELPTTAINRRDAALLDAFHWAEDRPPQEIELIFAKRWADRSARRLSWFRGMGWVMTVLVLGRSVRDRVTAPVRALRRARQQTRVRT